MEFCSTNFGDIDIKKTEESYSIILEIAFDVAEETPPGHEIILRVRYSRSYYH